MKKALDAMSEKDIYTLMLYALYKLKDVPEYASLSELSFVLDHDNLLKFIQIFAGTTIKVPTMHEFDLVIHALLVYQDVDLSNVSLDTAITKNITDDISKRELKETYFVIKEALKTFKGKKDVSK